MFSKHSLAFLKMLGIFMLVLTLLFAFSKPLPALKNAGANGDLSTASYQIGPGPVLNGPPIINSIYGSPNPAKIGQLVDYFANINWQGDSGTVVWYTAGEAGPAHYQFDSPGSYTVEVNAENSYGSAHASFTEVVNPPVVYSEGAYSNAQGATSISTTWNAWGNYLIQSSLVWSNYGAFVQVPVSASGQIKNESSGVTYNVVGFNLIAAVIGLNGTGFGYPGFDFEAITQDGHLISFPFLYGQVYTQLADGLDHLRELLNQAAEEALMSSSIMGDPPQVWCLTIAYATVDLGGGWPTVTGWWIYLNYTFANGHTSMPVAVLTTGATGAPGTFKAGQIWVVSNAYRWAVGLDSSLQYVGEPIPGVNLIPGPYYQPYSVSGLSIGTSSSIVSSGGVTEKLMVGLQVAEKQYGIFEGNYPNFGVEVNMYSGNQQQVNLYSENSNSGSDGYGVSAIPSVLFSSGLTYVDIYLDPIYCIVAFGSQAALNSMNTWQSGLYSSTMTSGFPTQTQNVGTDLPTLNSRLLD